MLKFGQRGWKEKNFISWRKVYAFCKFHEIWVNTQAIEMWPIDGRTDRHGMLIELLASARKKVKQTAFQLCWLMIALNATIYTQQMAYNCQDWLDIFIYSSIIYLFISEENITGLHYVWHSYV